jgi:CheY-like chemotaxis protein
MVTIVDEEEMGYVLGAEEYLSKPLNSERLASVLRRYRSGSEGCFVLVVEDDNATRDLIRRTLDREEGYTVRVAENGREALEQLEDTHPNVILLDLMMPEMDGFTFL